MEGRSSQVGGFHLVELMGPLGVVEVPNQVPGGGVGSLHLNVAFLSFHVITSINPEGQKSKKEELHDYLNVGPIGAFDIHIYLTQSNPCIVFILCILTNQIAIKY